MRPHSHQRRRTQTVVVVVLLLTSLLAVRWSAAVTHLPRALVMSVLGRLTQPLHKLSSTVRSRPDADLAMGDAARLLENLQAERAYNERLRQQLAEAREMIRDLSQIRGQMRMVAVTPLAAKVTGWSGDPRRPTLTLDVGQRQKIDVGMVVASGFNLVGRVTGVTPSTATVTLITAPRSNMNLLLVPRLPGDPDQVRPELLVAAEANARGDALEATVASTAQVEPGFVAHVHRSDPAWPAEAWGLVAGRVTSVKPYPDDPTARHLITIEPIRSLRHLTQVYVVQPSQPESTGGSR